MGGTLDDPHRDAPGPPAPVATPLAAGARLGRYLVLERLGEGGMGVVFAAWDERLERRVALKLLRADRPMAGDDERMLREARAVAQLNHPHVVAVHDAGVAGGEVFIALELVPGITLRRWLQEPHSAEETLAVFLQAGRGLAGAHQKGLVHRDFKPENVLVGTDGRVRVTDFGLARPPAGAADPVLPPEALIGSSTMRGTPAYMSPEQISAGRADARADQFAFCVALFEALYGEHPFAPREGGGTDALLHAIVRGELKTPRDPTRAPATVHAALVRGLRTQPDDRWPSMDALLAALPGALDAPRRRKRQLALLGAAVLAVGLIGAGVVALDRRARQCDPPEGPLPTTGIAAFDARAHAWWAAAKDACEAVRIRGEQSEAAWALRSACLRWKREELEALLPLAATVDSERVGDVAACADLDALASLVPPPADPRVSVIRKGLAVARAQATPEGLDGLVASARLLGWAPLEADALAQQSAAAKDPAQGHALAIEALLAAERGRDFDRAFEIRVALIRLSRALGRDDEAQRHARHAEALLTSRPNAARAAQLAAAQR